MLRVLLISVFSIGLAACAPAGIQNVQTVHIDRTETFNKDFDETWGMSLEWFASLGIPMDKVDKESGIITLEWGSVGANQTYIDCGEPKGNMGLYGASFERINLDINITMREVDAGTRATINVFGTAFVDVSNAMGSVSKGSGQCASKGILEVSYFSFLAQ